MNAEQPGRAAGRPDGGRFAPRAVPEAPGGLDALPATPVGLSQLQDAIASQFFADSRSAGFVLAGGAALIAAGYIQRETDDLDLFTTEAGQSLEPAIECLNAIARREGWSITPDPAIAPNPSFFRCTIMAGGNETQIDVVRDVPASRPPVQSRYGPAMDLRDAAARKLLALFTRASARDFTDLWHLSTHVPRAAILADAQQTDSGVGDEVLAQMFDSLARYRDDQLPLDPGEDPARLRDFYAQWALELRSGTASA